MPDSKEKKFRWFIQSANVWQTKATRTGGYVGTITYDGTNFNLSVSPDSYTSSWSSLKLAKNDFRKHMHSLT